MLEADREDRDSGPVEVVYIRAAKFGQPGKSRTSGTSRTSGKVRCSWWYQAGDQRNQARTLPGKAQTENCGLVFALREVLKRHRQEAEEQYADERLTWLVVRTDATYVEDGLNTHLWTWSRNGWRTKRGKQVANYVFWMSVDYELAKLVDMKIDVRVERVRLPGACRRI
jgi:hypothetical protein